MCLCAWCSDLLFSNLPTLRFCRFFFNRSTPYELLIRGCSSDVFSSDLFARLLARRMTLPHALHRTAELLQFPLAYVIPPITRRSLYQRVVSACILTNSRQTSSTRIQIGRASCRERVCQYV